MHSHKPKSQINPNSSLSQIQNQRTKGSQIPNMNTKYQIQIAHKPKRESQIKSKSCKKPRESKSPNLITKIKPSGNKTSLTRLIFHAQRRITPIANRTQNQVGDKIYNRV